MPPNVRFGSTIWSEVELAREGDRRALDRVVVAYRTPLVQLLQRHGFNLNDAEDLAQETFVEIVAKDLLRKAAPQAGRFRSLIIGVAKNVVRNHLRKIAAKKRGGESSGTVRDDGAIESKTLEPGNAQVFDQLWVVNLLQRAFKRLERDAKSRQNRQDEIVRMAVIEGQSYSVIAAQLEIGPGVVRNLLYRGKQKLLDYVREEIATYTMPGAEFEGEASYILGLIGGKRG
ncbi:MAG TPA: RNA polymerase sigma factor [Planctomycetota bacterium]|nr:RNA polymerase sigma factor [Planctomycetota bacterium]